MTDMAELGCAGGTARAQKLTPERRVEIAKAAALKRWEKLRTVPAIPMPRPDDTVREHHGVTTENGAGSVRIYEREQSIMVRVWNSTTGTEQKLTAAEARYLADQLYHLARRSDERRAGR
jgi:hypothetical protein